MTLKIYTQLKEGEYDLFKRNVKTGEWEKIRSATVDENGYASFTVVNYGEYKLVAKSL